MVPIRFPFVTRPPIWVEIPHNLARPESGSSYGGDEPPLRRCLRSLGVVLIAVFVLFEIVRGGVAARMFGPIWGRYVAAEARAIPMAKELVFDQTRQIARRAGRYRLKLVELNPLPFYRIGQDDLDGLCFRERWSLGQEIGSNRLPAPTVDPGRFMPVVSKPYAVGIAALIEHIRTGYHRRSFAHFHLLLHRLPLITGCPPQCASKDGNKECEDILSRKAFPNTLPHWLGHLVFGIACLFALVGIIFLESASPWAILGVALVPARLFGSFC